VVVAGRGEANQAGGPIWSHVNTKPERKPIEAQE